MDKIYEIFKSISAYFNLLLSISGVSLALLLSPTVDNMEDVFKELNALKKIDVGQYESFVQKRTSYADFLPKSGVSGYGLDSLLRDAYRQQRRGDSLRLNLVNRYNFTWKILPYVASYNLPPADGTLKDWESW
ncbi:MAG TPA: hypothetical protein VK484_01615, partial [Ferruginibacter sp.]|nr:hypothetical protein [Ferruginibacter sp.]